MRLFKTKRWTYWQIAALKLSMLSLGIAVGSYWPEVFLPYLTPLIGLTAILGLYLAVIYFRD